MTQGPGTVPAPTTFGGSRSQSWKRNEGLHPAKQHEIVFSNMPILKQLADLTALSRFIREPSAPPLSLRSPTCRILENGQRTRTAFAPSQLVAECEVRCSMPTFGAVGGDFEIPWVPRYFTLPDVVPVSPKGFALDSGGKKGWFCWRVTCRVGVFRGSSPARRYRWRIDRAVFW